MDNNYVPVKDHSDLVRDLRTKAILNVNNDAFNNYIKSREHQRDIDNMVQDYTILKNDVAEIKNMLQQILNIKS